MMYGIIIIFMTLAFADAKELPSKTVPSIQLKDQFESLHTIRFPSEKPVLLAIADREGAAGMNEWIDKSREELRSTVEYVGVADVRKAPPFLRRTIREKFKGVYKRSILLDWKASVAGPLNARAGIPNIYVVSREGKVLTRESGTYESNKLARIQRVLEREAQSIP